MPARCVDCAQWPSAVHQLDIASPDVVLQALDQWRPWAVINAAGYTRVDDAETHREACWELNTTGAQQLAAGAAAFQARLRHSIN